MAMLKLMERKSRLLKRVLAIGTKSQHNNAKRRFKKGISSKFRDSRALAEYTRLGDQMQIFYRRIAEIQAAANEIMATTKAHRRLIADQLQTAISAEGVEGDLRKWVLKRDGYQCLTCCLPRAPNQNLLAARITQSGEAVAENLQTICLACWESAASQK